jgi:hypothetical protein
MTFTISCPILIHKGKGKGEEKKMFTSHNQFLSILTGAVAGALITFGLVSFRSPATPALAQVQDTSTATAPAASPTVSPTPLDSRPKVEGGEIGEGVSREGGVFINDLANKLNVPVNTLESDISGSFNVAVNQAVQQGFINQADANQLASREANLFTSGNGFIFDIDEFPGSSVVIPVTGSTLTPTPTSTEEEVTATPTLEVSPSASPTPHPSRIPRPSETPRPTRTARPSSNNPASATPTLLPSMTPTPTLTPTQVEDFSLFYAP